MLFILSLSTVAFAELVGHWTFDSVADLTGNFDDLTLNGAELINGQLDLGVGLWAIAESYAGPEIGPESTLVSWCYVEDLDIRAGSILTLDRIASDSFNGIVYAERQPYQWMAGSSNFSRTDDFDPGFEETEVNVLVQIVITYEDDGSGGAIMTGYRNGVQIGQYTKGSLATWPTEDAEAIFGKRHFNNATNASPGDLDARIEEARIYNGVVPPDQITAVAPGDKLTTMWGAIKTD